MVPAGRIFGDLQQSRGVQLSADREGAVSRTDSLCVSSTRTVNPLVRKHRQARLRWISSGNDGLAHLLGDRRL
jgi:hypothetical protein